MECAEILRHRVARTPYEPDQARPDIAPITKVNHSQCIRIIVLIAIAHESCLLNFPRVMYTTGTGKS